MSLAHGGHGSDDDSDTVEISLVPMSPMQSDPAATGAMLAHPAPVHRRPWSCLQLCLAALAVGLFIVFLALVVSAVERSSGSTIRLASANDADAAAKSFRDATSAGGARESLQFYSDSAHIAGSARDKETAEYTARRFEEFGLEARVEEFKVLLNTPVQDAAVVQIVSPASAAFTATLKEAELESDPVTKKPRASPFHGFSPSGDVQATYVYVNYGRVEDYQALEAKGIDVSGHIVLCRYGKIFRGNKVDNAESRGAVGVIIYSDPQDDGFVKGPVYPEGPWRPASGVQRGSVFLGEGDPLTPGYPSTSDSLRLTLTEARDVDAVGTGWALPTIPSIPISWEDAKPLFEALGGPLASTMTADGSWVGGIDTTYNVGPGPAVARVKVDNSFEVKSIWNVFGTMRGSVEPDRWVMIGNHRDAWVSGGVDPSSGSAALLEVARGLGHLAATGWKPDRSIVLASWDAEEYGLLGSTEWVEAHYRTVQNKVVTYINVDEAVDSQGPPQIFSTPSLSQVLFRAAKAVPQPVCAAPASAEVAETKAALCADAETVPGETMYDFWLRKKPLENSSPPTPLVGLLGSGSDQTAFIAHAGVAALDLSFSGDQYGVYHSVYDSYTWMATFGDPSFAFHRGCAQFAGTLAIMLATDAVLPFDFTDYADAMLRYERSLADHVTSLHGVNARPQGGLVAGESSGVPITPAAATIHSLDITRLTNATARFKAAAVQVQAEAEALAASASSGSVADAAFLFKLRSLNDRLMYAERSFIAPEGLPGRTWYKHVVFTPSLHNSYGSTAFPAVNDALVVGDWRQAQRALDVVCHLLERATEALGGDVLPADTSAVEL